MSITIRFSRHGYILAGQVPEQLKHKLRAALSYTLRETTTENFFKAESPYIYTQINLTRILSNGYIAFHAGLGRRAKACVEAAGYCCEVENGKGYDAPQYQPKWNNLLSVAQLRTHQPECLVAMAAESEGIIKGPPAMGKTFIICAECVLYPSANIHVVVKGKDALNSVSRRIKEFEHSVGIIGGGKYQTDKRVTVISVDSLHKAPHEDCDLLLVDEPHLMATSRCAKAFSPYKRCKRFGLTATPTGRADGADMLVEALFGPVIVDIPYSAAVQAGQITPVEVEWIKADFDRSPIDGLDSSLRRLYGDRNGIWLHEARNKLIADKVRSLPDNAVVLVDVRTVYHIYALRKFLPEAEVCCAPSGYEERIRELLQLELITPDEPPMTAARRAEVTQKLLDGNVRCVISNLFHTGNDFPKLTHILRADTQTAENKCMQVPGRVMRKHESKSVAHVIDIWDAWDHSYLMRSKKRDKFYEQFGWPRIKPWLNQEKTA